ncbi:MAG: ammonium transporter [Hormoscilla sp.]
MTDILWILACSGLVFLMQPGFMCLESGLTRSKNSINVAIKNMADFGVSAALFWVFGYALMFGPSLWGWIGSAGFVLHIESNSELAAFFLFQAMFCGTATTIVSGAVAERMKFAAYLLVAGLVSSLIYPIFGHWVWNGALSGSLTGWLGKMGFVDFAGSTVVHSVGAWVSLAALLVVGPRVGRFTYSGRSRKIHGSNLQLAVLGAMLLWIGWMGFNGGSTLALNEQVTSIIVNTILAGTAGMITAAAIGWHQRQIPEVEMLINGSISGLVSITASCHAVTTPLAVIIGAIGSAVMLLVAYWLQRYRIDDAVDAVAVHGGAGVWGTLAVALFGQPELLNTGLSRLAQLGVQLLGILVCSCWAFLLTYCLLSVIDKFLALRVSPQEEKIGLNISEHRVKAEIYDLLQVMEDHVKTQDLSLRVPVEPFTEVGQIASRYNQVMDALQSAFTETQAVVQMATDAIITFSKPSIKIITANPSASRIFGYHLSRLVGMDISGLLILPTGITPNKLLQYLLTPGRHEIAGRRATGEHFPLEATVTEVLLGDRSFYTGTFRDISDRKLVEAELARAHEEISALSQRLQVENIRLTAELDITRQLQHMLLPKDSELEQIPGLDIAGFMEPANEVGGDYYDVLQHNGRVKIAIGDVTGHGLESGVLMIMVQTAVRTLLENNETDPVKFLSTLNHTIYDNVQRINSDKNLTLCLLDYQSGRLHLSGQHEALIVVRSGEKVELIDTIDLGFPIGLEADITDFIASAEVQLHPGNVVVLYTDGITEAEDIHKVQYGLERLCEVVQQNWLRSAAKIRQAVIDDVRSHIGQQKVYDDITLVVIKQK